MVKAEAPQICIPNSTTNGSAKLSYEIIVELWSLLNTSNFYGNTWMANFMSIINIEHSGSYQFPTYSYMEGSCNCVPEAACTQLVTVRVGNKYPFFQVSGISDMIGDCYFWLERCR